MPRFARKGRSYKPQAPSLKLQILKQQATSYKPRATSIKLQAASNKLADRGSFIKFHDARTEVLNADETIVWVRYMVGNLVG